MRSDPGELSRQQREASETMSRNTWNSPASEIAKNSTNYIRELVENLNLEPNPDKQMIALSIGDPTVFGNLKPPIEIVEAIKESVESYKYNGYTASTGNEEAKVAVAKYSSTDSVDVRPEDVILCSGCSCALDLCITVLANPGQNILVPRPGFPLYRTLAQGIGVLIKSYDLKPEKGWEVDLYHMESQIDEKTAAIVINNPSNPSGSVFSEKHLRDILDVASRNFVPIIADEIYEHMAFPGQKYHPVASLSKDVPILSCSGLTKRFLIPGWRMGWIIIHDRNGVFEKEVRNGLTKLSQRIIGSSTLIQGAIPKILFSIPKIFFDDTLKLLQKHAQLAYNKLSQIDGLQPYMPQGAMYMMVRVEISRFPKLKSVLEFSKAMVTEESVFCLPGECFDLPDFIRIVLTIPEPMLMEACQRIALFCKKYYKADLTRPVVGYINDYNKYKYMIPIEQTIHANSP